MVEPAVAQECSLPTNTGVTLQSLNKHALIAGVPYTDPLPSQLTDKCFGPTFEIRTIPISNHQRDDIERRLTELHKQTELLWYDVSEERTF